MPTFAQQVQRVGLLPAISYTQKTNELWQVNFKAESRLQMYEEENQIKTDQSFGYLLSDASALISRKIGLQNMLSGGYLLRLESQRNAHRFIQQYIIIKNYSHFRMAHRVVSDQTLRENQWTFRARYRITGEWPLQGHSLDINEWYLKINHEYLHILSDNTYGLETRVVPLLGYVFKNREKLETGIDYRQSLLPRSNERTFWVSVTYYMNH